MTRATVAVSFLLVVAGSACGGDSLPPVPAECDEESPPAVTQQGSTSRLAGFVRVTDVHSTVPEDDGTPRDVRSGRVQAGFGDFAAATSTLAQLLILADVCVGVTSRSISSGRVPVSAGVLELRGSAAPLELSETSTGVYVRTGELLLNGDLEIDATGAAFPAFNETLMSPIAFAGLSFDPPEIDPAGILIEWTPGDGDWVRVTIAPPAGSIASGGQVICQVVDDGCFALPASVASFVLSNNELEYRVTVERTRYQAMELGNDAFIEVEATHREELVLKSGVFE